MGRPVPELGEFRRVNGSEFVLRQLIALGTAEFPPQDAPEGELVEVHGDRGTVVVARLGGTGKTSEHAYPHTAATLVEVIERAGD